MKLCLHSMESEPLWFASRLIGNVPMIINNHRDVKLFMVDASSIMIWVLAVAMFIVACTLVKKVNVVPIYSLSCILSAGGIVCSINEFSNGNMDNLVSLTLTVTMLAILIYSLFNTILEITPGIERGRW